MIFVEFLRDLGGVVKKKLDFRGVPHGFGPFWTKKMTFEKFDPWSVPASQLQPGRLTSPRGVSASENFFFAELDPRVLSTVLVRSLSSGDLKELSCLWQIGCFSLT